MMINSRILSLILVVLSVHGIPAALADSQPNPQVLVTEINPARDVGYHVGDILHRTIILKAPASYKLLDTSLPLKGTEKKYRGQNQGVEVRSVDISEKQQGAFNIYTLKLQYQVFTNNVVVKPSQLPAEYVKFGGEGRVFQVRIPYWSFRISPLAVYGSVKIENDMSQLRGPLLLDDSQQKLALWVALGTLALSLLGLLYILGNRRWLPRMGGEFARAYRDIKKIRKQNLGLQTGMTRMHHALNQSSGGSVFSADDIIARKPGFASMRDELNQFFRLSRSVFFDATAKHQVQGDPEQWLQQFCRHCRDCERGLSK
jgi:mxaA protein